MENLRTATKEDFKTGATLITCEGYKFAILRKYDEGIWIARGDAGDVNIYESEAMCYQVKEEPLKVFLFRKTTDADLKEGLTVAFRDCNGEYTKKGTIQNIVEMDGCTLYDIEDCLFMADELKLIEVKEYDDFESLKLAVMQKPGFHPVTEKLFYYALEVLPPIYLKNGTFQMGEEVVNNMFYTFGERSGKYYGCLCNANYSIHNF